MWRESLVALLSVASFLFSSGASGASTVLDVNTTSGTFRGVENATGLEHWLGIPFAEAPVGSLRFKAPLPFTKHSAAVQNASTFGNACPQAPSNNLGAPQSEDCLFLNVRGDSYFHPVCANSLRPARSSVPAMSVPQPKSQSSSGST